MRQRRMLRRAEWMSAALLLPTLHACYNYVPLATQSPPAGTLVELQITDRGRVELSPRFGPGVDRITGRVASSEEDNFTLNVLRVANIDGENAQWSGEPVQLNQSIIRGIKGRQVSAGRTALTVVATAAVLYLTAGRALTGHYSGPPKEPDPGDPPVSNLIPRIRSIP